MDEEELVLRLRYMYLNYLEFKPIIEIIDAENPLTISDLSAHLDKYGYKGRHRIIQLPDKNINHIKIEIKIFLVNSNFEYSWPYNNSYILNKGFTINRPRMRDYISKHLLFSILEKGYSSEMTLMSHCKIGRQGFNKHSRIIEKLD